MLVTIYWIETQCLFFTGVFGIKKNGFFWAGGNDKK